MVCLSVRAEAYMTRDEVVDLASKLGYHEIKTAAGWIPLKEWEPYGDDPKARFTLDAKDDGITDAITSGTAEALGFWRLRT